jgi:glycosyltransferase involved in cell wall biosynthesis
VKLDGAENRPVAIGAVPGLRMVQVINTLAVSDGGPARNAFELNLALNNLGHPTDLVWIKGGLSETVIADETAVELPLPGPRRLGALSDAGRRKIGLRAFLIAIKSADVVIVHGFYLPWIPLVALWCRLVGTPFVITPHGSLTLRQQTISRVKKTAFDALVGRRLRRNALGFMTGSVLERDELGKTYPGLRAAVGGVGTRLPESYPKTLVSSTPTLLSISRLAPKKRIDLMIHGTAVLRSRGVDVRLVIAGDGSPSFVRGLHELASRLQISEHVTFAGQVKGMAKSRLYEQASVFLLPSDDENFGIGLAEALAHGVPCVASNKVAAAAFMGNKGGVVLEGPTPASIADAVEIILGSETDSLRREARAIAESSFSWNSVARQWVTEIQTHWLSSHGPQNEDANA